MLTPRCCDTTRLPAGNARKRLPPRARHRASRRGSGHPSGSPRPSVGGVSQGMTAPLPPLLRAAVYTRRTPWRPWSACSAGLNTPLSPIRGPAGAGASRLVTTSPSRRSACRRFRRCLAARSPDNIPTNRLRRAGFGCVAAAARDDQAVHVANRNRESAPRLRRDRRHRERAGQPPPRYVERWCDRDGSQRVGAATAAAGRGSRSSPRSSSDARSKAFGAESASPVDRCGVCRQHGPQPVAGSAHPSVGRVIPREDLAVRAGQHDLVGGGGEPAPCRRQLRVVVIGGRGHVPHLSDLPALPANRTRGRPDNDASVAPSDARRGRAASGLGDLLPGRSAPDPRRRPREQGSVPRLGGKGVAASAIRGWRHRLLGAHRGDGRMSYSRGLQVGEVAAGGGGDRGARVPQHRAAGGDRPDGDAVGAVVTGFLRVEKASLR